MEFKKDSFSLRINGPRFVLSGKLEMPDYHELEQFLSLQNSRIDADTIVFDFTDLQYLNSSGIRTFAIFFLGTDKKVTIIYDPDITWQKVGLVPLKSIKSPGIISLRKK